MLRTTGLELSVNGGVQVEDPGDNGEGSVILKILPTSDCMILEGCYN